MVNHDPSLLRNGETERVVPLGPSFGVRDWGGLLHTCQDMWRILRGGGGVFATDGSRHGAIWWTRNSRKQFLDRLPESRYQPGTADPGYVFFASWAWKQHDAPNRSRARFMRACRTLPDIRFEGGFAPRRRNDIPDIDDLMAHRIYPFSDWLARTRRSVVAFNTPAVHECLGWKLGEFLALGKAILSLPLTRQMPSPLVHGENVHFVDDNQDAMVDAIALLARDRQYRSRLERAARSYYLAELAPERAIRRLVSG
jgi:glycosyltransferase involved in cell wall biosynthesis